MTVPKKAVPNKTVPKKTKPKPGKTGVKGSQNKKTRPRTRASRTPQSNNKQGIRGPKPGSKQLIHPKTGGKRTKVKVEPWPVLPSLVGNAPPTPPPPPRIETPPPRCGRGGITKRLITLPATASDPNDKASVIKTSWYYQHLQCRLDENGEKAIWGCCAKSETKCKELKSKAAGLNNKDSGATTKPKPAGFENACDNSGYSYHTVFCGVSSSNEQSVFRKLKCEKATDKKNLYKFLSMPDGAVAEDGVKIMAKASAAYGQYFDEYGYYDDDMEAEQEVDDILADLVFEGQRLLEEEQALVQRIQDAMDY